LELPVSLSPMVPVLLGLLGLLVVPVRPVWPWLPVDELPLKPPLLPTDPPSLTSLPSLSSPKSERLRSDDDPPLRRLLPLPPTLPELLLEPERDEPRSLDDWSPILSLGLLGEPLIPSP